MAGIIRELIVKPLTRSPRWRYVRKVHLGKNPYCANCGKKKRVGMQVHHIVPFRIDPSKELDPTNLLTLCNNPRCHLDKGHLGYFKSWNPNVISDCAVWLDKYKNRPLLRSFYDAV